MEFYINPKYQESERVRLKYFQDDIKKNIMPDHSYLLLDIGCSQLSFSENQDNIEVYGIDKNHPSSYKEGNFVYCDLDKEKIPFNNDLFDFVVAGEVIEHTKRPFELIEEIVRVLKNGGILYLSTPNPYYYLELFKELFSISIPDDPEHLNLYTPPNFINFCLKNNLILISKKRYKFWIPFIKAMILTLHTPIFLNHQNIYKFKKQV
ncbi:MAG: class I SAM-dependent methyltransferase [Patescibacteria group bacterium]